MFVVIFTVSGYFRRVRKLRIATINFIMVICPSVRPFFRMQEFDSRWTDFREIFYMNIFRKYFNEIPVSIKSVKNNGYFAYTLF